MLEDQCIFFWVLYLELSTGSVLAHVLDEPDADLALQDLDREDTEIADFYPSWVRVEIGHPFSLDLQILQQKRIAVIGVQGRRWRAEGQSQRGRCSE